MLYLFLIIWYFSQPHFVSRHPSAFFHFFESSFDDDIDVEKILSAENSSSNSNPAAIQGDNSSNSLPALTQGNNSGIQDEELIMLRSEQQITYATLELQRQRMEMLQKRRRTD